MAKDFQRFCVQERNRFSRIDTSSIFSSILYKLLPREMCKFNSMRCLKKHCARNVAPRSLLHISSSLSAFAVVECSRIFLHLAPASSHVWQRKDCRRVCVVDLPMFFFFFFSFRSPFSFSIHSGNGCVVSLVCIAIASFISLVCEKQQRRFASLRTYLVGAFVYLFFQTLKFQTSFFVFDQNAFAVLCHSCAITCRLSVFSLNKHMLAEPDLICLYISACCKSCAVSYPSGICSPQQHFVAVNCYQRT